MRPLLLFPLVAALGCGTSVAPVMDRSGGSPYFVESAADVERIMPDEWQIEPVAPADRRIVRDEIARATENYPSGFVTRSAPGGIYVAKDIVCEEVGIGGTNEPEGGILLLGAGEDPAYDHAVARSLHHELMHVLLERNADSFPKREWLALNPKGFRYVSSGMDALREGKLGWDQDPQAIPQGFAAAYGTAEFDEDVAMAAEVLMIDDRAVLDRLGESPRLERKLRLLIRFLRRLDPAFRPPQGWDRAARGEGVPLPETAFRPLAAPSPDW